MEAREGGAESQRLQKIRRVAADRGARQSGEVDDGVEECETRKDPKSVEEYFDYTGAEGMEGDPGETREASGWGWEESMGSTKKAGG